MKDIVKEQENQILLLKAKLARAEEEVASYRRDVDSRDRHILQLQHDLNEIISLKAHLRKFVHKRLKKVDDKIEYKLNMTKTFQPVVPTVSDNPLKAARLSDQENLKAYNDAFRPSNKVRAYRKVKRLVGISKNRKVSR